MKIVVLCANYHIIYNYDEHFYIITMEIGSEVEAGQRSKGMGYF